jgi:hypothetical protein
MVYPGAEQFIAGCSSAIVFILLIPFHGGKDLFSLLRNIVSRVVLLYISCVSCWLVRLAL